MISGSNHCRRKRRSGYAMLIVMAVVLSSTALATMQMRYLDSALRIERARMEAEDYSNGALSVLAVAIERLQSGDPPVPVQYGYQHTVRGVSTWYEVRYSKVVDRWTVTADPSLTADALTPLPASF